MRSTVPRGATAVAAVVPALAAAIAGGAGITRTGLNTGEAATVYAARLHLPRFLHLIRHVDLVHASYYRLMHIVVQLGGGIVAMRSVSLVATVAAAAVLGVLGTRLSGSAVTGSVAGLLFALCPTVDAAAKSARSYGILPLLVVLTLCALLWAMRSTASRAGPARLAWAAYGVVLLATVYLHELSLLLLAAFAVSLVLLRAPRRTWITWASVSAAVVVLTSPLVYYSHREDRAVAWIKAPGIGGLLTTVRTYTGPSNIALAVYAVGAAAALVAGVITWRAHQPLAAGSRLVLAVAAPIAVVPPVLLVVESSLGTPLFNFRYVSYYQPAAALLAGHGLVCLGRWAVGMLDRNVSPRAAAAGALAVGVAGAAIAFVVQLPLQARLTTAAGYYRDYGAVVRQIEAHSRPGDAVAYLPPNLRYLPDGYPQLRELDDYAQRRTPEQAGNFQGREFVARLITDRMRAVDRVWAIRKPRHSDNPRVRLQLRVLHQQFRLARHWSDNGVLLELWVRKTTASA